MTRHPKEYITLVTGHSVCTDDISCGVYTAADVIKFNFEDGYASLVEKIVTSDGGVKYRTTAVRGLGREVKEGRGK